MTKMDPLQVARGVPLVNDRLLLELINDLHTADDLTRTEGREGFFARLLSQTTGRKRGRDHNIRTSMINAQRLTIDWLSGLQGGMTATNLVVAEVSDEVVHVKDQLGQLGDRLSWTEDGVRELAETLADLATETGRDLSAHARRLSYLESRHAMDDAILRWRFPRPDPDLPWLIGVVLLAREAATGPAGEHAYHFDRTERESGVEQWLTERILQNPPKPWFDGVRSVAATLAAALQDLPSSDHRLMVAELLGVGISDQLTAEMGPLTYSIATAAAQAALPGADPSRVARAALRDSVGNGSRYLPASLSVDELVRFVVAEQFAEARVRHERLRKRRLTDD